ncbi:MAG: L-2-hydroxyglutarate oxidase [Solirubrobacteraceae bacterium]|nr:L-2-hydroxyglutarate oxidase [Solirubrobacteraceae bacterium]
MLWRPRASRRGACSRVLRRATLADRENARPLGHRPVRAWRGLRARPRRPPAHVGAVAGRRRSRPHGVVGRGSTIAVPAGSLTVRFCVVGGGILGLATARQLALEYPDASVTLVEKEAQLALHQTGRNSGVVHAGVYYEPGSLKARLCRRGAELLAAYCAEHALPYEACGKVVVATSDAELGRLHELHRRSIANGVPGARLLDAGELRAIEPRVAGVAGLHSPTSAITDYTAVARQMAKDLTSAGGQIRLSARVQRVAHGDRAELGTPVVVLDGGDRLRADRVIVCAGLQADLLAQASGAAASPRIVPFRGEYFALVPQRESLVRGLVYPVPDPDLPFLGIHLTRRIGGGVLVGPNAVLALGRESYRWRDVHLEQTSQLVRQPSTWRLAARYPRVAATELRRSISRRAFVAEARRYVPELRASDVVRASAGVRAQAVDDHGALVDDFVLDQDGPIAWVRNAPSPAATSSMAIAEELVARLTEGSVPLDASPPTGER